MRDNKFAADLLDMMEQKFNKKLDPIKKGWKILIMILARYMVFLTASMPT